MPNPTLKDSCRAPDRGSMRGVALHNRSQTTLCGPCRRARAEYIETTMRSLAGVVHGFQPRTAAFLQDYFWLISTGETHTEAIAARLNTKPAAMERRLYVHGVTILHEHAHHARRHSQPPAGA